MVIKKGSHKKLSGIVENLDELLGIVENLDEVNFQLATIIAFAKIADFKKLTKNYEAALKKYQNYESIGFVDGNPKYFKKLELMDIAIRRTKKILDLIAVINTTAPFLGKYTTEELKDLNFF